MSDFRTQQLRELRAKLATPPATKQTLANVQAAGQDFEWYPTTAKMIAAVAKHIDKRCDSIMDIGAGDGRVLADLAKTCEFPPKLYSIEKSGVLIQAQPNDVIPVGTDFFEQNLACLKCQYIFCNPPYSEFETWASIIIESGYAEKAFLVIPKRWKESPLIAAAIKKRGATTLVIHTDDFHTPKMFHGSDEAGRAEYGL